MSNQTFYLSTAELHDPSIPLAKKSIIPVEVREVTKGELSFDEACRVSPSDATTSEVTEEGKKFKRVQVFRHAPGADEWIEVWLRID